MIYIQRRDIIPNAHFFWRAQYGPPNILQQRALGWQRRRPETGGRRGVGEKGGFGAHIPCWLDDG